MNEKIKAGAAGLVRDGFVHADFGDDFTTEAETMAAIVIASLEEHGWSVVILDEWGELITRGDDDA